MHVSPSNLHNHASVHPQPGPSVAPTPSVTQSHLGHPLPVPLPWIQACSRNRPGSTTGIVGRLDRRYSNSSGQSGPAWQVWWLWARRGAGGGPYSCSGPCDPGCPSGRHIPWQDSDTAGGGWGARRLLLSLSPGVTAWRRPQEGRETEPQAGWQQTPGLPEPLLWLLVVGLTFPSRLSPIWGSQSWE